MYALLRAILDSVLAWVHRLASERGKAIDAPTDVGALRRAGDRVRKWMHASGARERKQPDQDGT